MLEIGLVVAAALGGYGVTWGVDRRQKPSVVVGGAAGAVAALLVMFF